MSDRELAVVVGATGDFGRSIVERLVGNGLSVIAVGRDESKLDALAKSVPHVSPCIADITDDASIDSIRNAVNGTVRLACHGPGLSAPGNVTAIAPAALSDSVNIKVGGMLRLVRSVDHALVKDSRLIAIAGHYGLEPTDYACAPGVANAALFAVMRQLSIAYGPRGVTVHTIAPGPADTARLRRVVATKAGSLGVPVETVLDELRAEGSTGELVTAEQVAWAVSLYLASEAAATTGSTLMLDGGRRKGLP